MELGQLTRQDKDQTWRFNKEEARRRRRETANKAPTGIRKYGTDKNDPASHTRHPPLHPCGNIISHNKLF